MKSKVSVCIITRDDPHLDACLKSFHEYVDEIVVVITSKNDTISKPIAEKYNCKIDVFDACNDNDRIVDFSLARNHSISLASNDWIMWIDSDDILVGAENLVNLTSHAEKGLGFIFPYEYSYANDKVNCKHYRERLIYGKSDFHFINPVHEVLVPKGIEGKFVRSDDLIFKHQRQYVPKAMEPGRNLRILQKHVAANPDDVRQMYYIGLEYKNCGDLPAAIKYLTMYIERSGWDDERAMAAFELVKIYTALQDYNKGLEFAIKSIAIKPTWFESYYNVCKMFYHLGDWQKCVAFADLAEQQGPTETLLFIDENDRYDIYSYTNVALNNIGRVKEAYEAAKKGLIGNPNNSNLIHNKLQYEIHLGIQEAVDGKLNIVFATPFAPEVWTPDTVRSNGIGGSEMMLINQAKNLAALGHNVIVYAMCSGKFDGVEYRHFNNFGNITCDVLVVSRYTPFLGDHHNIKAKVKLLWVHDVAAAEATNALLLKADKILALSEWHKETLIRIHNVHPDHVITTRNGIDLERFNSKNIHRNQMKCINSSSPDRSWPILLEIWPEILKQVPEAELHLFYGFDNWKKMAVNDRLQLDLIERLEKQIKETPRVYYHGRVNQTELAEHYMNSSVWVHPTWFTETSCITAMEAQAAGLHIVTSNLAALKETVKNVGAGELIDGEWTSPEYKQKFINATVRSLRSNIRDYNLDVFDLNTLAVEWNDMFYNLIEDKKILPYVPSRAYQLKEEVVKLNIAAGPNVFPFDGWINYDKEDFKQYFDYIGNPKTGTVGMPDYQIPLARYLQGGGKLDFRIQDMTEEFYQHPYNSVDIINVGQAIEHLNYTNQAPAFIENCYKMLKPGGLLRMSTPDINLILNAFNSNNMMKFASDQPEFYKDLDPTAQLAMILYGASGPDCRQDNYEGHFFCYSEVSMTKLLKDAGFRDIEFYNWNGQSKSNIVKAEVVDHGLSHSFIVEAIK